MSTATVAQNETGLAMLIPIFETARLILRGVTAADAPAYEKHFVDWVVISHLGQVVPWPYPPGGVRTYIETAILPKQGKDKWVWGIFRKQDPMEIIGVVDLWRPHAPKIAASGWHDSSGAKGT
jgi:RimJ/RimL family protein N-acetyltransferase